MCDLRTDLLQSILSTEISWKGVSQGRRTPEETEGSSISVKKIMKCRLEAEIIAYRRSEDMDVRFPDGVVVKNVGYGNFKRGMVGHPKD